MTALDWNFRGHDARREARWSDAIAAFTAMIAAAEAEQHTRWRTVAYVCRGLCHRQLGETGEAIDSFTGVSEHPAPTQAAFYYRGNALLAAARFDEAEADHRRFASLIQPAASPIEPVFAYPPDLTLAECDCSAAIDAGHARPAAFFARACARELQRLFPGAIADYERASSDPLLAGAANKALARARIDALGVRPGERHLMQPGVEYCCVTYDPFDGSSGSSVIEYYDLDSYRAERCSGGTNLQRSAGGWQYSTGSSDKEGSTSYYYRPRQSK